MGSRLELQNELEEILGSQNVYYQPPTKTIIRYPAIVFNLASIGKVYANNEMYRQLKTYEVTLIDPRKDSEVIDRLFSLKYCTFDRTFVSENLNHYVFKLNY